MLSQVISSSVTENLILLINDFLLHQIHNQSATDRLLIVSRTNYAQGSPAKMMFSFSLVSVKL